MNCHYSDILSRIAEPPKWWDEHAVPRYCAFKPDECASIYAVEVAFVEIDCQNCGATFHVCFSWNREEIGYDESGKPWIKIREPMKLEEVQSLHYGDPPNAACCPAGPTMNSESRRVLEFWRKNRELWEFERVPELEINLKPFWEQA